MYPLHALAPTLYIAQLKDEILITGLLAAAAVAAAAAAQSLLIIIACYDSAPLERGLCITLARRE